MNDLCTYLLYIIIKCIHKVTYNTTQIIKPYQFIKPLIIVFTWSWWEVSFHCCDQFYDDDDDDDSDDDDDDDDDDVIIVG